MKYEYRAVPDSKWSGWWFIQRKGWFGWATIRRVGGSQETVQQELNDLAARPVLRPTSSAGAGQ